LKKTPASWRRPPEKSIRKPAGWLKWKEHKEGGIMASKARAEGNCNYRLWTTEEQIDAYAWEAKRINQEDRKRTQQLIKQELKRRFDATLRLLDDEQTTENPKGTYRYLLNEKAENREKGL
jgi:hypothetical protein